MIDRFRSLSLYLGMGFLLTHEMDAMTNQEWRVLPFTRWLPEGLDEKVFIYAHVPLYALIIALIASQNMVVRQTSRVCVALFFLIHGLLHVWFSGHEAYQFHDLLSHIMIYGAAVSGLLYLVLSVMAQKTRSIFK